MRTMRVLETMRQHEVESLDQYAFEDHPDHYSHHYRHNEKWVRVEGWEDYYSVSNQGRIRGEKRNTDGTFPGRLMAQGLRWGYPQARLTDGFRLVYQNVHRLVAVAFHGPPPTELHEVNHKDGNRRNNRASNLEWVTHKENIQHYHRVLRPMITGKPWAPLPRTQPAYLRPRVATEAIVREMRDLFASGVNAKELADRFRLKRRTVYSIIGYENWKHVD